MGRLTGCCCCFDLRDGARAVGITLCVLSTLGLVSTVAHASLRSEPIRSEGGIQIEDNSTAHTATRIICILLHLIFNALLIRGVEQKSRGLIRAWLIYSGIMNGIASVAVVVFFVYACVSLPWWVALVMLGVGAWVGVLWYWFVVVLHFFKEMTEQDGLAYGRQVNEGEKHTL